MKFQNDNNMVSDKKEYIWLCKKYHYEGYRIRLNHKDRHAEERHIANMMWFLKFEASMKEVAKQELKKKLKIVK